MTKDPFTFHIISLMADIHNQKRVVALLQGGLGNQCFIYAAARALALREGSQIVLDGSYFCEDRVYRRRFALSPFLCGDVKVVVRSKPVRIFRRLRYFMLRDVTTGYGAYCCEKRPNHFQLLPTGHSGPIVLDGYFQTEKYFYDYRERILRDFTIRDDSWIKRDSIAQKIASSKESVFLHVRSYREVPGKEHGELALQMGEYYLRALSYLESQIKSGAVFVFSDDIEWTKRVFLSKWVASFPEFNFVPVDGASNQLRDFTLMRYCKHGIVADSSFSWWAGWLGEQKWLAKGERPMRIRVNRRVMNDDFWPERWVAI